RCPSHTSPDPVTVRPTSSSTSATRAAATLVCSSRTCPATGAVPLGHQPRVIISIRSHSSVMITPIEVPQQRFVVLVVVILGVLRSGVGRLLLGPCRQQVRGAGVLWWAGWPPGTPRAGRSAPGRHPVRRTSGWRLPVRRGGRRPSPVRGPDRPTPLRPGSPRRGRRRTGPPL